MRTWSGLYFVETQKSVSVVKEIFSKKLARNLNLVQVEAPLLVQASSGIQDDLNGVERPVQVEIKTLAQEKFQVVQSLAKWKRHILGKYEFRPGEGLYTHMRALRPDEDVLGPLHSVYVDQWDWERVMGEGERTLTYLNETVQKIYSAVKETHDEVCELQGLTPFLPEAITFIHTEDLALKYPTLSKKQREDVICREYGAVFLIGIGGELPDGEIHDGRAPDYDDWTTPTLDGKKGLNGDILIWHPVLKRAFEISSMGIRVDKVALSKQLIIRGTQDRLSLPWHQQLMEDALPQTIGGGIGQSRLCMLLLQKSHIGEVQFGIWSDEERVRAKESGAELL